MVLTGSAPHRDTLSADHHRPAYHFLPAANWMNDPNGFIQWQGRFHLFYQYNPYGPVWGDIHWGHAVSADLIHWTDEPLALTPTPGSPDEAGCFSGCAVDNNGTPTLVYTGVVGTHYDRQTQCLATSDDSLRTWTKYAGNPVLSEVPAESGQTVDFRDPFVWKADGGWYMLLGSNIKDIGGTVFLYRSDNLIDWQYLKPLHTGDKQVSGSNWECPNFFPLGDKWVLIVSVHTSPNPGIVQYFVGDYVNHHFTPLLHGTLDYGLLYAPLTTLDDQNRRLLIGWLRESRSEIDQRRAGWSGVQSIPRVLSLDARNRLVTSPVPELESLRGRHHHCDPISLTSEVTLHVCSQSLDIEAAFELDAQGHCALSLACADDGSERVDIAYEAAAGRLSVRTLTPDLGGVRAWQVREVPHVLDAHEGLTLRILLDGSVVEIIANGRTSLSHRSYASHPEHGGVRVSGFNARLTALDLWEMPSIWQ